MDSIIIQSAINFDEKRDYELRRLRRTNSSFSTCSSSNFPEESFQGRHSRQASCSSDASDSSLYSSPGGKARSVRFALDERPPVLPLSLTFTPLTINTKREDLPTTSSNGTHTRKRSREESHEDFAWWAQRRFQQDAEWNAEQKRSEKETSDEDSVRHL